MKLAAGRWQESRTITLDSASSPDQVGDRDKALAALLGASAGGDRQSFSDLYRQTAPQLFAVVLRILKQHDRAEEVLQEVFVKVWNSAGRYNPQLGTPMAWMMTIARNRAIDHLRRHGRTPQSAQLIDVEIRASPDPGPLELTQDLERGRALERCLERLADGQRSSILLAYLDGYTHQEIAQRLGSPLGTVKSWIRRGQINLKRCLES